MTDRLKELMNGTPGHFWTDLDNGLDLNEAANGYVRRKEDNLFHIETLTSLEFIRDMRAQSSANRNLPRAIYGATHAAGSVFYDLAGYRGNNVMGATRASSGVYKFHSVLVGINLGDVASDKLTKVTVLIPEVIRWSGMGGVTEKVTKDSVGRTKTYDASLHRANARTAPTRRGITLSLTSRWSASGPMDRRVLSNPLAITTESARPKDWWDHIEPIMAVQDLINMAFQGFVVADTGTADLHYKVQDQLRTSPELWIGGMMTVPTGSKPPKSMTELPVFNLQQIGGIRGVDGWIELARKYPRATGPLAQVYRFGSGLAVETRCMEIAAAIDYWSEIHRRAGATWAGKPNGSLTQCLAKFAGRAFEAFVSDADVWSKIFRDTYNRIKHEPAFSYDAEDVYTITRSAEILLQSALLNRIARNKKMTPIICDSHRNYQVGIDVRKIVARGQL